MRKICYGIFSLLIALAMLSLPNSAKAQVSVGISITTPPPPLPAYTQPLCPGPRYIWTPGYWAWGPDGYYWVPGTWVLAPEVEFLWTPGYWGWGEGVYVWHAGYWGPEVGFYGGIDYGFGYTGVGYVGGYWRGGVFVYNRSVNRIDTTVIHNTYYKTVEDRSFSRVSYNGGRGGIDARPTARQQAVAREPRIGATATQVRQERLARSDRQQLASENRGRPAVAATQRPGDFQHGSVAARGAAERNASYRVDNSRRNAAETRSSRTRNSGTSNSRTGNTAAGTTRSRERTPTRENGNARVTPREEKAPTRTAPGRKAPAHTSHSTPERNSNARTEKAPSHTEHAAAAHTSHATREPTPKPARNTPEVKESHNARPPAEAYSHGGQPSHAAAPRENTRQEHGSTHAAGRSTAHSSGGGNHGTADVGHGGGSHSEPKQK